MADLDKKNKQTQNKKTKIEKEIKEYETRYPYLLVNGTSILSS